MSYALTLVTPPIGEPISVDELKKHLRITQSAHDPMLANLITAARAYCEQFTNRQLITATWKLELDAFPDVIRLPRPPLQWTANTHIKYYDTAGVQQTLVKDTDYVGDTSSVRGRIRPAYGKVWPTTQGIMNAVEVQFDAGYGVASAVPQLLKLAMMSKAALWFTYPESVMEGYRATQSATDPNRILWQYKVASFG